VAGKPELLERVNGHEEAKLEREIGELG